MRRCLTAAALLSLLAACKPAAEAPAPAAAPATPPPIAQVDGRRIANADAEPGIWVSHGRTYSEQRHSPLKKINTETVKDLGLAWHHKLEVDRGTESTPIVVDGVMYVTSAFSILTALDARTGQELWKFDPQVPREAAANACCDVVNRGVAVWKGQVFLGSFDGRLIALDARTGAKNWEIDTIVDRTRSYSITGAPRVIKDKVIIGNGGGEFGVRGYLAAYDVKDGKLAWRFYTVPGNPKNPPENKAMEIALPTWSGERYFNEGGGGGGTVWDSMAYDPELDLLYIGTGNGSSWNRQIRSEGKGDNLFLSSIVALRPDSGEYVWHYQTTPGDTWDYTATQHMILADLPMPAADGGTVTRKVLMQAPKNGFFYVLDRTNGQLISAEKFVNVTWASHVDPASGRPVEDDKADWTKHGAALVFPGPLGAHNWQPMSFNPDTGLVYIPAQQAPHLYEADNAARWIRKGIWNVGTKPIALPENEAELQGLIDLYKGSLLAWDPVAQKVRWRQEYPTIWNGGTLSTAGNLVFQGTADGRFVAYRADTGEKLWEAPANTGVMSGPVSWELDGEQYVTVTAGWGGAFPLAIGGLSNVAKVKPEARVLTYKLGGKAQLPAPAQALVSLPELPPMTASAEAVAHGRNLYNGLCGPCHGVSAIGGGVIPDLRYMSPSTREMFAGILAGAKVNRGMPAFSDLLKPEDVEAIHGYLIQRSHDLKRDLDQAASARAAATSGEAG
ncbi:MAG TPA: PQQ-dependent dehydrogenase, methanol/ethanol family [Nevskiaceae bacterium]|nr:PQQ-dependent dehydrogenase, methanol/ethanol family [Nevskiaceae bacterium]